MDADTERKLRNSIMKDILEDLEKICGGKPQLKPCTNAWLSGKPLKDIRKNPAARYPVPGFYANCFMRILGTEDRVSYLDDLYHLRQDLLAAGRKVVIANGRIAPLRPSEIDAVTRGNFRNIRDLIAGLLPNFGFLTGELRRLALKAFTELMAEERLKEKDLSKIASRGVYLIGWLRRYHRDLFESGDPLRIGCFFYMGGCCDSSEALFCRFLARLPADVVIFCPDLRKQCCLEDHLLYEIHYNESLEVSAYPDPDDGMSMGTAAYHAERDQFNQCLCHKKIRFPDR